MKRTNTICISLFCVLVTIIASIYFQIMELVRGSCVFLYERQLNLVTESAKSMTALARLLVDVFFPKEKQENSNLSGENGLQRLNKTTVDTIICKISCLSLASFIWYRCIYYSIIPPSVPQIRIDWIWWKLFKIKIIEWNLIIKELIGWFSLSKFTIIEWNMGVLPIWKYNVIQMSFLD